MHNFRKLTVWSKSMDLVTDVMLLIETLPKHKKMGLANQLERSAVSIPSNIAEGAGRQSEKEYFRFLNIAYSSSFELETQLLIAERISFFESEVNSLIDRLHIIQKMLYGLMRKTKK